MTHRFIILILIATIFVGFRLQSQTIAEKKAGSTQVSSDLTPEMQNFLVQLNRELKEYQDALKQEYARVLSLFEERAPESSYSDLLRRINSIKDNIQKLEKTWVDMVTAGNIREEYALWHQPDTTLGQLIMDYGSQDFVYLFTPEISQIKLSVDSNLPIPRSSWNEMLELILAQNGVGFKQLNPYLRQLYLIKQDKSTIRLITNKREDLEIYPNEARICFVLTPEPSDVRRVWLFLEKFANPNSTVLQVVGRDILLIASAAEVQELLKLYDFVSTNRGDKEYKAIPLLRVNPVEMSKILATIFDQLSENAAQMEQNAPPAPPPRGRFERPRGPPMMRGEPQVDLTQTGAEGNGLRVITLGHISKAIFLVGTKEEIKKAEQIIQDVEAQVGGARQRTIFRYTVKNSDPEELANVLEKIYYLMVETGAGPEEEMPSDRIIAENAQSKVSVDLARQQANAPGPPPPVPLLPPPPPPINFYDNGFYLDERRVVNPNPDEIMPIRDPNANRDNFIVDPKTSSIVMVVEADILPKLKELLKKLDVPKKMVQIEVLLFEKRVDNDDIFGLNLLRLGDAARNKNDTSLVFNDTHKRPEAFGVTQFFLSRAKTCSGIPAFDLIYKFLLSQEDIQINASPSILTLNQTPALISIEDEISVNTGILELPTNGGILPKAAYQRARYGIKIEVNPIIHVREEDDDAAAYNTTPDYITLESAIAFETIDRNIQAVEDRPDVTRRIINNIVNLPDGQSVIIGGLRRKEIDDRSESIPFLGDLPGLGKLFSQTRLIDRSTEMFIIITPKIVQDPAEELEHLKLIEATRRPGDIPSFLAELQEARECERTRLMRNSIKILFGREPDRIAYPLQWECDYDGRE